ncbi:Coenzyme F420 hydrogenase/dehydrogenase, beta subunit C-terminal domain [Candidatus Woesearchaeota archaeon]|nr:Coenzyme F420 hydrogenase/dehydrogenase, beta subunit C-terminal domain [Candidatus Woesearchaeota archaeon]
MSDKNWEKLKLEVIDSGLCTHCGSCVGLSKTLSFKDSFKNPIPEKTSAGKTSELSYLACPGREVNYPELNKFLFKKLPKNWLIGNYEKLFIGYSKNEEIRRNSSSGGIITHVTLYLLEKKYVNGAIVLNPDKKKPFASKPVIATTKEQVLASSQSIYVVTPLNTILSEADKFKSLAYVGLPDEVASIRKLQQLGKFQNINYVIGLYTGIYMHSGAIESYLRAHGVKDVDKVKEIKYRAGEWPGNLRIELKDGRVLSTPKFYYNYLLPFYVTNSSLYMCDFTNELTDISVGDAWHPKYEKLGQGFSVVAARTKKGLLLLEEMKKAGLIELQEVSEQEALSMHGHMLDFKKRGSFIRLAWKDRFVKKGKTFYGYEPVGITKKRMLVEAVNFMIFSLGRTWLMRRTIEHIPIGLMGRVFNVVRKSWKAMSKPTKRKGLHGQEFRVIGKEE